MTQANSIRLLNEALDALEQHYGPDATVTYIKLEEGTTDCFHYTLQYPSGRTLSASSRLERTVTVSRPIIADYAG